MRLLASVKLLLLASTSLSGTALGQDDPPEIKSITVAAHEQSILGVAFSPNGKTIWTAGEDGITKQWNLAEKSVIRHLGEPRERVNAIAVSRDGKSVATGGRGAIGVWSAESGQVKFSIAPKHSVVDIDLSPDGRNVAVAYYQTDRIDVIEATGGTIVTTLTGPSYPGTTPDRTDGRPIGAVAWSPDGKYLAAFSAPSYYAAVISLYDAPALALRARFLAHAANRSYCLAFSPDSKLLACGTQDSQVKVFDVATVVVAADERAKAVAASKEAAVATVEKLAAALGADDFDQREAASRELSKLGSAAIKPLKKLVVESSDAEVRVRAQAIVDRLTEEVDGPLKGLEPAHALNVPRIGNVRSLAFSPDGRLLAVGCMKLGEPNGQLELWRLDKPDAPWCVVNDQPVNGLEFSPNGKLVASGLTGGKLLLTEVP